MGCSAQCISKQQSTQNSLIGIWQHVKKIFNDEIKLFVKSADIRDFSKNFAYHKHVVKGCVKSVREASLKVSK